MTKLNYIIDDSIRLVIDRSSIWQIITINYELFGQCGNVVARNFQSAKPLSGAMLT